MLVEFVLGAVSLFVVAVCLFVFSFISFQAALSRWFLETVDYVTMATCSQHIDQLCSCPQTAVHDPKKQKTL